MRVLLTGAGGFIGRSLTRRFRARGAEVTALGREQADVSDRDELLENAGKVEALVHLAFPASPGFRSKHPLQALSVASSGTANAIHLARACQATHLVIASSGKVYGTPRQLPLREDHGLEPGTFLGKLKLIQETIGQAGAEKAGLAVTGLRIFNVYGPGQKEEFLVPKLIEGFRRGGELKLGELDHRRDWIHLEDLCRAFETVLDNPPKPSTFRPVNAGSGGSTSVRELIDLLAELSGSRPSLSEDSALLRPGEPEEEYADVTRLKNLGWEPRIDLRTGLSRLRDGILDP